jgi:hypothetical protein
MKKKSPLRKLEEIPTFSDVARLTMPGDTPRWLAPHLEWWADGVRHDRMLEDVRPTKAETKAELKRFAEAIRYAASKAQSPFIRHFLENEEHSGILPVSSWQLNDLAERADSGSTSTLLVDKHGKGKRGRGKPKLPNYADAKTRLAARVIEIWIYFFKGKQPGLRNRRLAEIAQAYWVACGGLSEGYGDPCNGWYKYFKLVRDRTDCRELKQLRQLWRIDLVQTERKGFPPCPRWLIGSYYPKPTSEIGTSVHA